LLLCAPILRGGGFFIRGTMKYYVYEHFHPVTGEVVYIGKGTAGRAWSCGSSTAKPGLRGNRTAEHNGWITALLNQGFTPADFVRIIQQGLTNNEALKLEKELLDDSKYVGLFNRLCPTKLTQEQVRDGRYMLEHGIPYSQAANKLGVSTMTLWRAMNGKTKGINYGV